MSVVFCLTDLQDELLDVVHWLRQGLALICGLIWGLFGIQGFAGLAGYVASRH